MMAYVAHAPVNGTSTRITKIRGSGSPQTHRRVHRDAETQGSGLPAPASPDSRARHSLSKLSAGEPDPQLCWGHLKEGNCFATKNDPPSSQSRSFFTSACETRIMDPQSYLCPNLGGPVTMFPAQHTGLCRHD